METLRCYGCDHEWQGDPTRLVCPMCESEFIEVACVPSSSRCPRPPPPQMPDMTLVRRPMGTIVSVPLGVLNFQDYLLTNSPQIDDANPPPADLFRAAHNHDHDHGHNHDDETWAPLGSRRQTTGMPTMGLGGFMNPQNNLGPHTYTYRSFPLHRNSSANSAAPDFSSTEFRQTPNGGSFYFSQSYSYRTPGATDRSPEESAQAAQALTNISAMLQGLMDHTMGRPITLPGHRLRSPPQQRRTPFMGFPSDPTQRDNNHTHDPYPDVMNEFWGQPRAQGQDGNQQGDPMDHIFGMMRMMMSGQGGLHNGDAATTQEDFDRIMSQLLEQAQRSGGEPPAEREEVEAIPKITVDANWLEQQEHKECTICMEEAQLGDELSMLWCGHWYHPFCIKTWLDAHGACPLCRKTLKDSRKEAEERGAKAAKEAKHVRRERRRSSRVQAEGSGTQERRGHNDDRGARDGSQNASGSSRSARGGEAPNSSSGGGIVSSISSIWDRLHR